MENNNVQFDEPKYHAPKQQADYDLFVGFLIKKGFAKNKTWATYILLGIIVFSILVIFLSFSGKSPVVKIPKNANVIYSQNAPPRLAQPLK